MMRVRVRPSSATLAVTGLRAALNNVLHVSDEPGGVDVVYLDSDADWHGACDGHEASRSSVRVAVVRPGGTRTLQDAMRAGFAAAVPHDATLEEVLDAIRIAHARTGEDAVVAS